MAASNLPIRILAVAFIAAAVGGEWKKDDDCVYTVYVRTGSIIKGGTDSKISATIGGADGRSVHVSDMEDWGLMGLHHDYFERGNLDVFSGKGGCISSPPCFLNLTSDGSGPHHGWFCDYVEVTSTGPHLPCAQSIFYVDRWIADDAPPYSLSAILDGCHSSSRHHHHRAHRRRRHHPFVVRGSSSLASQ